MRGISIDAIRRRRIDYAGLGFRRSPPKGGIGARTAADRRSRRPEPVVVRAAQWLVMGERRGRLTEGDTAIFLRSIGRLAVTVDGVPDETAVLTLAPLSVDGLRCRVSRAGAERNSAASNLGWRAHKCCTRRESGIDRQWRCVSHLIPCSVV